MQPAIASIEVPLICVSSSISLLSRSRFQQPQLRISEYINTLYDRSTSLPHSHSQCHITPPLESLFGNGYFAVRRSNFLPVISTEWYCGSALHPQWVFRPVTSNDANTSTSFPQEHLQCHQTPPRLSLQWSAATDNTSKSPKVLPCKS